MSEGIVALKTLIDADTTNDFFLFPFMSSVLNLVDGEGTVGLEKGFITDLGMRCLYNDINSDFEIVNDCPTKPSQKAVLRLALYFTLCYNLIIYFGGFVVGLQTEEGKKYADKLPVELLDYLKSIMERVDKLHPIIEHQLKRLTQLLTDKYAKIFNEEKRKHWTKEIFETTAHIPAHPNDLPKGFSQEESVCVPPATD
jgi:hypothetical protein